MRLVEFTYTHSILENTDRFAIDADKVFMIRLRVCWRGDTAIELTDIYLIGNQNELVTTTEPYESVVRKISIQEVANEAC